MADRPPPIPKLPQARVISEGKPLRGQTSNDRDAAALKRRAQSPIPEEIDWDEDLTGKYEGEELRRMRRKRDTDKRIEKLEDKHDELAQKLGETREDVREIKTETKGQTKLLERLLDDKEHVIKTKRERITKVIGLLTSGGFVVELLHRLGVL